MPYPPKNTFGQTAPGTALDPQSNPSVIGIGNADTVTGTANDPSMIGFPMPPFGFEEFTVQLEPDFWGYEALLAESTDWEDGGEIQAWLEFGAFMRVAGFGFVAANIPAVSSRIVSASLLIAGGAAPPPLTTRCTNEADPAPFTQGGSRPSGFSSQQPQVVSFAPIAGSVDVTELVRNQVGVSGWASGNRINFVIGSGSLTQGNFVGPSGNPGTEGDIRLQITYQGIAS